VRNGASNGYATVPAHREGVLVIPVATSSLRRSNGNVQDAGTALYSYQTRAGQLDNAIGAQEKKEAFQFFGITSGLDGNSGGRYIDNAGAENGSNFNDSGTDRLIGFDFDEHEFSADARGRIKFADGDDIYELSQLFYYLIEDLFIPGHRDRHAGHRWILCLADGEAVDIEAATAEKPGNPTEHARSVFHKGRHHVPVHIHSRQCFVLVRFRFGDADVSGKLSWIIECRIYVVNYASKLYDKKPENFLPPP